MRAFIVRPFGTKDGVNFDEIQKRLIDPALDRTQIAGDTTAAILEAGNIRVDMFQLLLLADLVIADISVHNANVFYELGIRHALRSRQTVLIRAKSTKPRDQRGPQDEVPFDLRTDRYFEYDSQTPENSVDGLVRVLTATGVSERADSPVFQSLPALEEQDRSRMTALPRDFREELDRAFSLHQIGKLALLGAEAHAFDFVWELEALRLVARALYRLSAFSAAEAAFEKIRDIYPSDVQANLLLGTVFQRLGKLADSEAALRRALDNPDNSASNLAEAYSLLGRNDKVRLTQEWAALDVQARRTQTLQSKYLLSCYENYRRAYLYDLNHFYSGLNALAWITVAAELIPGHPQIWAESFETDDEAQAQEKKLLAQQAQLVGSVGLSLDANEAQLKDGRADIWLTISKADYRFLTSKRPQAAAKAYKDALSEASIFEADSARTQIEVYRNLDLFPDRVAECLAVFPAPPGKKKTSPDVGMVIVFTGHMIDRPDRPKPRFPPECEEKAREAIREKLKSLTANPEITLGLAGGACGGDILFHEECSKLGIRTRLRLSLPPGPFVARSVAHAGEDWVGRFWRLSKDLEDVTEVLGSREELPDWLRAKESYDIWQRTNIWLLEEALSSGAREVALIALWDGEPGDGPGGTQHLVQSAASRGVNVVVLNTKSLFGL